MLRLSPPCNRTPVDGSVAVPTRQTLAAKVATRYSLNNQAILVRVPTSRLFEAKIQEPAVYLEGDSRKDLYRSREMRQGREDADYRLCE